MRQASCQFYAIKGDTWNGASFAITVNGAAINLSGVSIEMSLRDGSGNLVDTLTSAAGDISITGANTFSILPFIVLYDFSQMKFDIKIIFTDGTVKTYIKGIFSVMEDL